MHKKLKAQRNIGRHMNLQGKKNRTYNPNLRELWKSFCLYYICDRNPWKIIVFKTRSIVARRNNKKEKGGKHQSYLYISSWTNTRNELPNVKLCTIRENFLFWNVPNVPMRRHFMCTKDPILVGSLVTQEHSKKTHKWHPSLRKPHSYKNLD